MSKQTIPLAINLRRSSIALCTSHSPDPVLLNFPATAVKDMEVISQSELDSAIKTFVTSRQIHPCQFVLVVSNEAYFEKPLHQYPDAEKNAQIQAFIDSVPLASTSYKVFHVQNKEVLIVINRNYYEAIKHAFATLGFTVTAVIPDFVLGEPPGQFTANACRLIFKKLDFLIQNSFLQEEEPKNLQAKEQRFLKAHQNIVILLVILAVIFAAVMVVIRLRPVKKTPTRVPKAVPTLVPRPKTPITPTPEASPSANLRTLSVQILNASGRAGIAAQIQSRLSAMGIPTIKAGNAPSSSISSIGFSNRVWPQTQTVIRSLLSELYPQTSFVSASPSGGFDLVITVGKLTP